MLNVPEDVKIAYRGDTAEKRIRIHFPNGEHDDLVNEDIVTGTMRFTESICSEDNIKFGLCEASQLNFSTIACGNIKGCEIEAYNEIYMEDGWTEEVTFENQITDDTITLNGSNNTYHADFEETGKDGVFGIDGISVDVPGENAVPGVGISVTIGGDTHTVVAPLGLNEKVRFNVTNASDITITLMESNKTIELSGVSFIPNPEEVHMEPGYYSVPLGSLTVYSCKRNANGFKRDVVAYGQKIIKDTAWTKFERWKKSVPMLKNEPYSVELSRLFAVQINTTAYLSLNRIETPFIGHYSEWAITKNDEFTSAADKSRAILSVARFNINFNGNDLTDFLYILKKENLDQSQYKNAILALQKVGVTNFLGMIDNPDDWVNWGSGTETGLRKMFGAGNLLDPKIEIGYGYYDGTWIQGESGSAKCVKFGNIFDPDISGFKNWNGNAGWYNTLILYVPYAVKTYDPDNNFQLKESITFFDIEESLELYDDVSPFKVAVATYPRRKSTTLRIQNKKTSGYSVTDKDNKIDVGKILNSYVELSAGFGRNSRTGEYEIVHINNNFGLYPSETLYPSTNLYPKGASGGLVDRSLYRSLWYDDYEVKPFGTVVVTYKDTNNEEQRLVYQFDADAENTYYMDDNYILLNSQYTEAQVKELLDTYFIPNIKGISYYPAEITMKGLPYVEAGDVLQVLTVDGGFETFVFNRTLSGVQSLTDDVEAMGDEVNQSAYAEESEEE